MRTTNDTEKEIIKKIFGFLSACFIRHFVSNNFLLITISSVIKPLLSAKEYVAFFESYIFPLPDFGVVMRV